MRSGYSQPATVNDLYALDASACCFATSACTASMSRARTCSIRFSSADAGSEPGCENTSTCSRKTMSVGIDMMLNAAPSAGCASVSTLPNTMSGLSLEACSKTGPNCRQGPHQSAQKSNNTMSLSVTVASSVSVVIST